MLGKKKLCGREKKWSKEEMRRGSKITTENKKVNSEDSGSLPFYQPPTSFLRTLS